MWYYLNEPVRSIEQLPDGEELFGFVYRITNLITGKIYIGRKQILSRTKKPLAKRDQSTDKRKKKYTYVIKETNWREYYGSSESLLKDIRELGAECFRRDMIELAYTKKYLTWAEIEHQIKNDVLRVDSYNDNVMGRYYRKDIVNNIL